MSSSPKVFVTNEQKQTLHGLLETQAEIFGSQLSFFNLDVYKEQFKGDWDRHQKTIREICLRIFRQKLDGDSALVDLGESFVVLFFNNYGKIQKNLMSEIAGLINQAIKSHEALSELDIPCEASTLKPDELKDLLKLTAEQSAKAMRGGGPNARDQRSTDILYQAVVAMGKRATIALNCMPRYLVESKKQFAESKYLLESEDTKRIDLLAFEHALGVAFKMARKQDPRRIIFSINFNNLKVAKFRKEYEHALKQAPKSTLERLIPKLVRVPPNTPPSTVENTIITIRHFFEYLAMEAAYSKRDRAVHIDDTVSKTITSVHVPKLAHLEKEQLPELAKRLRHACVATQSRSLAHGIENYQDLVIAKRLGFDFVCGSAIHDFTDAGDVPMSVNLDQCSGDKILV